MGLDASRNLEDIAALENIIKKAINLKEEISCERGMYRFFFLNSDGPMDEERATIPGGEEPTESIMFCVFPGIECWVVKWDESYQRNSKVVQKAQVKPKAISVQIRTQ